VYHSITIGEKNTWDDWHLMPTSRPSLALPPVKEKVIDIPGRNGTLDLSEYLTGSPVYGNRKGSWEFYVMHDYWTDWNTAYLRIVAYCHGKTLGVVLEDDPTRKYTGRLKVSWRSGKDYSIVTIEYDLDPYATTI
jgi:hypothetical protein